MPTDLPAPRRRRQPWLGQRLVFLVIGVACMPIFLIARVLSAAVLWLDPDPPD